MAIAVPKNNVASCRNRETEGLLIGLWWFGAQERGVEAVGMVVAHRIDDKAEICET
jgi:hypothetical protein